MDYIFLASIMGMALTYLSISYDIACQWSKNLSKRVQDFPSDMQSAFLCASIRYFVPKFHLTAHGDKCQGTYSLNWHEWSARCKVYLAAICNQRTIISARGVGYSTAMSGEQKGGLRRFRRVGSSRRRDRVGRIAGRRERVAERLRMRWKGAVGTKIREERRRQTVQERGRTRAHNDWGCWRQRGEQNTAKCSAGARLSELRHWGKLSCCSRC